MVAVMRDVGADTVGIMLAPDSPKMRDCNQNNAIIPINPGPQMGTPYLHALR